jgi:hypothetical protein
VPKRVVHKKEHAQQHKEPVADGHPRFTHSERWHDEPEYLEADGHDDDHEQEADESPHKAFLSKETYVT